MTIKLTHYPRVVEIDLRIIKEMLSIRTSQR